MKKFLLMIGLCFLVGSVVPVFAQDSQENSGKNGDGSEFYYVNVPIERVYPYRKGYVVEYKKVGFAGRGQVYLPMEWFAASAGKGEYVPLPNGSAWPYLAIYYKSGEFSHVRLYVRKDRSHETWGNIPQDVNLDDRFENVSDIKLER